VLLCSDAFIGIEHLPMEKLGASISSPGVSADTGPSKGNVAARSAPAAGEPPDERQRIIDALAACAGNQSRAAKVLGIARRTLVSRLDDYKIPRPKKEV
jgi:two-component system, NtrC family, response regulator AtoC